MYLITHFLLFGQALGGTWLEDESNASTEKYPRNAFRLWLVPLLASLLDRMLPESIQETGVGHPQTRETFGSCSSGAPGRPRGGAACGFSGRQPATTFGTTAGEVGRQSSLAPLLAEGFSFELRSRHCSPGAEDDAAPHAPQSPLPVRRRVTRHASASGPLPEPSCPEQPSGPLRSSNEQERAIERGFSLTSGGPPQSPFRQATEGSFAEARPAAAALRRLASSLHGSDRILREREELEQGSVGGTHQPEQRQDSDSSSTVDGQEEKVARHSTRQLRDIQEMHLKEPPPPRERPDLDGEHTERRQPYDPSSCQEMEPPGLRQRDQALTENQPTPIDKEGLLLNFLHGVSLGRPWLGFRSHKEEQVTKDQNLLAAIAEVAAQIYGRSGGVEALMRRGAALARQSAALQEWIDAEATAWEKRHLRRQHLRNSDRGGSITAPPILAVGAPTASQGRPPSQDGRQGLAEDRAEGLEPGEDAEHGITQSVPESSSSDKENLEGEAVVANHGSIGECSAETFPLEVWQSGVPSLFLQQQLLHRWLHRASGGALTLSFNSLEALAAVLLSRRPSYSSKNSKEETSEGAHPDKSSEKAQEGHPGVTGRRPRGADRPSSLPVALLGGHRENLWHVNLPGRFAVFEHEGHLYLVSDSVRVPPSGSPHPSARD